MRLFTERSDPRNKDLDISGARDYNEKAFNYDKFPVFSKRKNMFTNTEKGAIEMCEKVDQLVKQTRIHDLFGYVQKGGMTVTFAAKESEMTPKEFRTAMQKNGYKLPQRRTAPATAK